MTKRRANPEQTIHRAVIAHLRARGVKGAVFWHCPNGGARSKVEAAIFKGLGVRAGIPDILILHNATLFCLELKAELGSRVTEAQFETIAALQDAGAFCCVATGLDRAISVLEQWGLLVGKAQSAPDARLTITEIA